MVSVRNGVACLLLAAGAAPSAQQPVINSQLRHARGQAVVPIYEGWYEDAAGAVYASFGYVNLNLEEALDVPLGPDNAVAPGPVDQGQPTHFLPGHRKGVFAVRLPGPPPHAEIRWTLSVRGRMSSIPSNLGPLYQVEGLVTNGGSFPGNRPPVLRFARDGAPARGAAGRVRAAPVETVAGTPAAVDVWVTDDGLPAELPPFVVRSAQGRQRHRPGRRLAVTWSKYRGPGAVHFADPSPPIEDGRARATVRFGAPGEYMLRALATDGSGFDGCCWTNGYVRARVE